MIEKDDLHDKQQDKITQLEAYEQKLKVCIGNGLEETTNKERIIDELRTKIDKCEGKTNSCELNL